MSHTRGQTAAPDRLVADERREMLLDAARDLMGEGGPDRVSMGTVAERADVTRALVYKHFANRADILAALYRRETARLDEKVRAAVLAAPEGLENRLRALIRAMAAASATHAEFFVPLRAFGQDAAFAHERRAWNLRTLDFFTAITKEEYTIDPAAARPAIAVLLLGIVGFLNQAPRSTPDELAYFEQIAVEMFLASLERLATRG